MKRSSSLVIVSGLLFFAALVLAIRPSLAARGAAQDEAGPIVDASSAAAAASPVVFSYQGELTNASGAPITNASLSMSFRLFPTLVEGVACWTETQNVNVQNGQFNVLLGQSTAIPTTCLSGTSYLEISVGADTLSPRELLTSVPYAVQANALPANAQVGMSVNVAGDIIAGAPGDEFLFHTRNSNNGDYLQITSKDPGGDWKFGQGITLLDSNGNVGIGTRDPQARLDVSGNTIVRGDFSATGDVLVGGMIALRRDGNVLNLLPFGGGEPLNEVCIGCGTVGSGLYVRGGAVIEHGLEVYGGCTQHTNGAGTARIAEADCEPGTITSGAYVEANLMTPEERAAESIDRFEQGDLLCWSATNQQLELCSEENDRLVMAVANTDGKPIVLGAEPVKVLGPVVAGDLLVASDVPGHAMVNNNPLPGTVIGQALEDLDGGSGVVKAMIRKW